MEIYSEETIANTIFERIGELQEYWIISLQQIHYYAILARSVRVEGDQTNL